MKRTSLVFIGLSCGLVAIAPVRGEDTAAKAPVHVVSAQNTVTAKATVEAIDLKTRAVTLKDAEGRSLDIIADGRVKNLAQVHVGDVVEVRYHEAVAVHIIPGGAQADAAVIDAGGTAKPGAKPAAAAGRQVSVIATIEAIDTATQHVTLRGPQANLVQVKARNPDNLKKVKVGDSVRIDYVRAVAISVSKPGS